jgi:hypothetical protein
MIKQLLFTTALLVPGLAYAANPSADLSVQVIPARAAGTCGATGQAATDAAAAGFNTVALCNDFTTPIPNTVGTGLPGNWLDCTYGGPSGAVWYFGSTWYGQDPATCSNVVQTTDPVGNLALDIPIIYSKLIQGNTSSGYIMMKTTSFSDDRSPTSGYFPFMYQEITFRFDQTPSFNVGAFWDWNSNYNPFAERDSWECGGFIGQKCNTEATLWNSGGYDGYWANSNVPFSTSFDPTQYHTWGVLWTGDGNGNYSACTYVDGVRNSCHLDANPVGANASAASVRERLQLEHALYDNVCTADGNWSCLPNFGTRHMYIKNVKVLSCPSWTSTSAMCNGTTNNGNFYQ